MRRSAPFLLVLSLVWFAPSQSRADDFVIEVKAQSGKKPETVDARYPSDMKASQRAVLTATIDAPVTVKWIVRRTDKETAKDVLVHFFVVKIDKADQQQVPDLKKNVVAESALTMDFKAKDKSEGEISFAVPNPGRYLLRLELKNAGAKDEPFAALDLLVR